MSFFELFFGPALPLDVELAGARNLKISTVEDVRAALRSLPPVHMVNLLDLE